MKIRVERDGLADAVAWVARSLPSRPPVPVLGGVLLDAGSDGSSDALTVSGFDYEVSATVGVPATIADGGRLLVSGRLLADITKALPAQPVEIFVDGSRASITCGNARFSLPTMPVEDYPALPAQPALAGEVAGDAFGQAVTQVAVAAGKDDTLPMLTGMRLEISGSTLTLVATDRFRLAMREFTWEPAEGLADAAVLVPARTLAEAAKSLGASGAKVSLSLASGEGLLGLAGFRPLHHHPAPRRGVPAVPAAAARPAHLPRGHRRRPAVRGDQARVPRRRAGYPGAAGVRGRFTAVVRGW